jgi:xanthine dehydrogenase accessory factor
MQEIFKSIDAWQAHSASFAIATVVQTWGSSPQGPGAKMAVNQSGAMVGSVSGGCIEGAVVESALRALKRKRPKRLRFGVTDDTAWGVGLSCGGNIEVFVDPVSHNPADFDRFRQEVTGDRLVTMAVVVAGPADLLGQKVVIPAGGEASGALMQYPWSRQVVADARALQQQRQPACRVYPLTEERPDEVEIFFDLYRPAPRLVVVGGVHIAVELIHYARRLGFTTYLLDPRTAFATRERFSHAHHIIHQWPDEALTGIELNHETSVVVVTHDPKLDDPALQLALPSQAGYVGALGSKKTQARRRERLLAAGMSSADLDRLHAPIGIDLGGRAPAEIALAIMAEIVSVRNRNPVADK